METNNKMPTKRRPSARTRRKSRITPEAVDLCVRCKELWPTYLGCIRDNCQSRNDGGHCEPCREFLDQSLVRNRLLSIEPWEPPLEEITTAEPAPCYDNDPMRRGSWRRIWKLIGEIEDVIGAKA